MTLEPGQKLGPYEITEAAGAGGMGEVYKAKDTRLDRIVALKILPEKTAMNADLRARFEREAKSISSLNHPNICTLYDIGHQDGVDYLVMEYLEGETLSERIKSNPLDLKEALDIATQIANALDHAHRQGLIHRDLKPANVILTREGAKLLDFGLAKLKIAGGVVEGISGVTRTSTPLTGTGTIIGTIQYMSPEQLDGNEADHRSDIFAFGALMYEMLTGQRAFDGKSQASLIAAIIEREPPAISTIKPMSPPGLDRLVKKCLAKDPDSRWQSVRDLADELRWISQSGSQAGIPQSVSAKRRFRFRLAWTIAALTSIAAITIGTFWFLQPKNENIVKRFTVPADSELQWADWPQISPDGQYIAYNAITSEGIDQIWIRPLSSNESYLLPGTEGSARPFWSPDSRTIGFTTDGQVKKVSIAGGPVQLIANIPDVADGSWGSQGTILLDGDLGDSIKAIPANGGTATIATLVDSIAGERFHAWPEFMPDGKHFVFCVGMDSVSRPPHFILKYAELGSYDTKKLLTCNSRAVYSPEGYLLYVKDKTLYAHPFDATSGELTGEPVPIVDRVRVYSSTGGLNLSVSNEGTMIYLTRQSSGFSRLIWHDRNGRPLDTIGKPGQYGGFALSPDGKKLAYEFTEVNEQTSDIWIYDLIRDISSRLTFSETDDLFPTWSPDGKHIYFAEGTLPNFRTRIKPSNGTGESVDYEELAGRTKEVLTNISSDGSMICVSTIVDNQPDLYVKNIINGDSIVVGNSSFIEWEGAFSPNQKYISLLSVESGINEIYVRQLDGDGKWQISNGGGYMAQWRADGKELYYFNSDNELTAVPVKTEGIFSAGIPVPLFKKLMSSNSTDLFSYAVSADGQRFLVSVAPDQTNAFYFDLVINWAEEIKKQ